MMNKNEQVLINGRMCQFLGTIQSDISPLPLELFMDVTVPNEPCVHIEDKAYGRYRYKLSNIPSIALTSKPVRTAIRAYEDFIIEKYENLDDMTPSESFFLNDWLLSSRS